MGVSMNHFCGIGVILSLEKKANPLWGKFKYDPQTGRRIEEFIFDEEVDSNKVEQAGFEFITIVDNYKEKKIFIGFEIGKRQQSDNDCSVTRMPWSVNPGNVNKCSSLELFLIENNIPSGSYGFYSIAYLSC